MTGYKFGLPLTNKHACDVCDTPLNALVSKVQRVEGLRICRSFECQTIIEKHADMTPFAFKCFFEFHSGRIKKRKLSIIQEKQRITALTSQLNTEHQVILDRTLAANPSLCIDQIHLVEIPTGLDTTSPLEIERLERYTCHLRELTGQAKEYESVKDVPFDDQLELHEKREVVDQRLKYRPNEKAISDALCGMCKGGCCTQGKDKAYLSVLTLRRYMDAHPSQSVDDVLNSYLSLLSDKPITNACINQTTKGCALPRDMRSDLCNGFFCEPIVAYQKHAELTGKSPSVLAIQRANTNWNKHELGVDRHVVDQKLFSPDALSLLSGNC